MKKNIIQMSVIVLLGVFLWGSVTYAASVLQPIQGGTGKSTAPALGQVLKGNAGGTGFDYFSLFDSSGNIIATIIPRLGTSTQIAAVVLEEGEFAYATNTQELYIGDGVNGGGYLINSWKYSSTTGNVNYSRGNVGIGTTSPYKLFSVAGNAAITGTVYTGTLQPAAASKDVGDPNNRYASGWFSGQITAGTLDSTDVGLAGGSNGFNGLLFNADDSEEAIEIMTTDAVRGVFDQSGGFALGTTSASLLSWRPGHFSIEQGADSGNSNNASIWVSDQGQSQATFVVKDGNGSYKAGFGTSTPWAKLAVMGKSGQLYPEFEVASSTGAVHLSVSGTGNGTTTLSGLTITGSASSTSNVGFNLTTGCFARLGICDQVGDSTLTSLAAYNTNGILTQTAADTFTGRTITGNSQVTVTNGSGVSGNPTLSITGDSIGDSELTFNTGQNLTTASSPVFSNVTASLLFKGGTSASMNLNGLGNNGMDINFANSGLFRSAEVSVLGTNDVFFQGFPGTTAGYTYLESWNGAGLVLGTGNGSTPIIFRPNRSETARITGPGFWGIATATPWAQFSINPLATNTTAPSFAIGSSTGTTFLVTNGGNTGIGSTTPFGGLSIGSGLSVVTTAFSPATSTSQTVDWKKGNFQTLRIGTSAVTVTFTNSTPAAALTLEVCNPLGTASTVVFNGVLWPAGTLPTHTTTAQKCDLMTFRGGNGTSTPIIYGGYNQNY